MATRTLVAAEDLGRLGVTTPTDQGLLAWTFDPASIAQSNGSAAGLLFLWQLVPPVSGTASNILINLYQAGSGLTAGQCFAGLYNAAGTLLGGTGDQSGPWASTGLKTMAITSPPTVTAGNRYWVATLWNGSGTPGISSCLANGAVNAGLTPASYRAAATGSSLTALPSSFTPAANQNYSGMFWAALS